MAGSLNHIVGDDGRFSMDTIENMGDAHEALEECFDFIHALSGGNMGIINHIADQLNYPRIKRDLVGNGSRIAPKSTAEPKRHDSPCCKR
jgi:hypothetical protein